MLLLQAGKWLSDMHFTFLWIVGGALVMAWLFVQMCFVEPKKMVMPRSWYSTPVIGLALLFVWVLIQVNQLTS